MHLPASDFERQRFAFLALGGCFVMVAVATGFGLAATVVHDEM